MLTVSDELLNEGTRFLKDLLGPLSPRLGVSQTGRNLCSGLLPSVPPPVLRLGSLRRSWCWSRPHSRTAGLLSLCTSNRVKTLLTTLVIILYKGLLPVSLREDRFCIYYTGTVRQAYVLLVFLNVMDTNPLISHICCQKA